MSDPNILQVHQHTKININTNTSDTCNGNGHIYRRYGFYRFVPPEHRREFLEWLDWPYNTRVEPPIRSGERG